MVAIASEHKAASMTAMSVEQTAIEARRLRDLWDSLSRQHVSMAAGCSCGIGGITVLLQDFEQDIVDYLLGQAEKTGRADIIAFLNRHALRDGLWHIGLLLDAVIEGHAGSGAPETIAAILLQRLGRTLGSFAKLHG